ncbi:HNH endonuclease [Enterococcus sp. LJL99]
MTANGHTNEEIAKFYASAEWRRTRAFVLSRDNYICQPCLLKGYVHEANLVHHKEELRSPNGWERRLDVDNLEAINRKCHNKEKHYYSQNKRTN